MSEYAAGQPRGGIGVGFYIYYRFTILISRAFITALKPLIL